MEKNRYLLTMMVVERAKKLMAGDKPLIKTKSKKPVAIALQEIKAGKVYLKKKKVLEKEEPFKRVLRFSQKKEIRNQDLSYRFGKKGDE